MRPIVINLKIANRSYPVKTTSEEQEKSMRKAAHLINIKIEQYHEKYEVKDIQDVLSMICLDAVFNQMHDQNIENVTNDEFNSKIEEINKILDSALT